MGSVRGLEKVLVVSFAYYKWWTIGALTLVPVLTDHLRLSLESLDVLVRSELILMADA